MSLKKILTDAPFVTLLALRLTWSRTTGAVTLPVPLPSFLERFAGGKEEGGGRRPRRRDDLRRRCLVVLLKRGADETGREVGVGRRTWPTQVPSRPEARRYCGNRPFLPPRSPPLLLGSTPRLPPPQPYDHAWLLRHQDGPRDVRRQPVLDVHLRPRRYLDGRRVLRHVHAVDASGAGRRARGEAARGRERVVAAGEGPSSVVLYAWVDDRVREVRRVFRGLKPIPSVPPPLGLVFSGGVISHNTPTLPPPISF